MLAPIQYIVGFTHASHKLAYIYNIRKWRNYY